MIFRFGALGLLISMLLLFQNCSQFGVSNSTSNATGGGQVSPKSLISSCSVAGQTVPDGGSISLFAAPYAASCAAEVRSCSNGQLSGSATSVSCLPSHLAILNPTPITVPGCNDVTWSQIPGMLDYFVGRMHSKTNPDGSELCSGLGQDEVYTLAWGKMDWTNHQITSLGKLIDLSPSQPASIQGGKYKITTAYDPSIIFDGTEYWIAFECGGIGFTGTAASCMSPISFGSPGGLDLSRAYVVVMGNSAVPNDAYFYSASVPKLFKDDDGRVYLYWSAVKMTTSGVWQNITTRATELVKNTAGQWAPVVAGIGMSSNDPSAYEVFGLEDRPGMHGSADTYQIIKVNGSYILSGSTGDCLVPTDAQAGCYRMTLRKSATPLGTHIFNAERMPEHLLPSNFVQYTRIVTRPSDGALQLNGSFGASYASANVVPPTTYLGFDLAQDSYFFDPDKTPAILDPEAASVGLAYEVLLKRNPDQAGLNNFVVSIYGGMTDAQLISSILNSAEASALYQVNSLTPPAFVTEAWQSLLGHSVDSATATTFVTQLSQGTQTPQGLLIWLTQSLEFTTRYPTLAPLYQ